MDMATATETRRFTLDLPVDTALEVEEFAASQNVSAATIMTTALIDFRRKLERTRELFAAMDEFSEEFLQNHPGFKEEDIPGLVKEVRAQRRAAGEVV